MKKKTLLLGISLLVLSGQWLYGQIALENGIVQINSLNGYGTGFVFYRDAHDKLYVLTANHVVSGERIGPARITVKFQNDGTAYPAQIYYRAGTYDVAVIALEKYPENIPILYLGKNENDSAGKEVTMYGYPSGNFEPNRGTIKRYSIDEIVLDDIQPAEGNSGGPIIQNSNNAVLGIIIERATQTETVQRALNINYVRQFLLITEIVNDAIIDPDDNLAKGGGHISEMFYLSF